VDYVAVAIPVEFRLRRGLQRLDGRQLCRRCVPEDRVFSKKRALALDRFYIQPALLVGGREQRYDSAVYAER
jgi:hypothetical protein